MFEAIDKIDNVFRYAFLNQNLIASFKNEDRSGVIRTYDLAGSNVLIEKHVDSYISSFLVHNENIFCTDVNNDGCLFSDMLEPVLRVPSPLKISIHHSIADIIPIYQGRIKSREFGVYSIPMNKVLWMDSQQKALETFGNEVFGQSGFEIHRTEPNTGEVLWRSDLEANFPELSDIKGRIKLLGLCENLVIAAIENIDKLIALDLATGELKWDRTTLPAYYKLDKVQNRLHIATGAYKCLDPLSGEAIDSFEDQSYFKEVGIFSQRNNYAIDGNHLITTDHKEGVIGAFNTATHKFDWLHKEEGVSFPAPSPVIYQAPYLLVHDNLGTLHVFKRS